MESSVWIALGALSALAIGGFAFIWLAAPKDEPRTAPRQRASGRPVTPAGGRAQSVNSPAYVAGGPNSNA